jgi:dipeptidyl aminopeptidase/acylaminoacyl peptidase
MTPTAPPLRPLAAALAIALAAACVAPGPCPAQEVLSPERLTPPEGPHMFGPTDLWAMHRLSDVAPSPDGKWIAYTEKWYDVPANKSYSNIWLVAADGKTTRRLTSAKAKDSQPDWSPDGRTIAFLSDRGGSAQIWAIDVSGGEAWAVSGFPIDVTNLRWSPHGNAIAFTAEVYATETDFAGTAARDKMLADDPITARLYDRLQMRHWDAWDSGKRSHLFVARVADGRIAGTPIDLMKGADMDCPVPPFGGRKDFAWAPDGRTLALCAKERKENALRTDDDIYIARADGSSLRCVTEANEATDSRPVFSPDGRTLAYRAMARAGHEADKNAIVLLDVSSGRTRILAGEWDRSADEIVWSGDGRTLYVTAGERARQPVFAIDVATARVRTVVADKCQSGLAVAPVTEGKKKSEALVFLRDSMTRAAEVHSARTDGSGLRALTRVNDARFAGVGLSEPEEFWFAGALGDSVHGWILRPVGYESGKKYPVAFVVHGGPQGSVRDSFHYRWNPQIYAGAGYATVAIDFHGSTGYGQAFTDAINKDWGGKPYEDLMKGLDHVIANYSFVDGSRVAALGGSYGGFMVFWMAGHTDRFACLVAHDGSFDGVSAYYGTEELWFPEWEYGGAPWENREVYDKWSPERHVENWKTPMLVIHGAKDYRLPETEGFGAFTALQRRGIPSQFLYFPDENHWVLKPLNALVWHETVLGWLDRWTDGGAGVARRDGGARGGSEAVR